MQGVIAANVLHAMDCGADPLRRRARTAFGLCKNVVQK